MRREMATLIASCCWSRAGNFNRRSSGTLLSPVRNCLARSVSRASWRCVAAHSSWQVVSSLHQAVSSQEWLMVMSFGLKAQTLLGHRARAKSSPSRSQLWVRFWFPDLVPRRCLHTVRKHIIGLVVEYVLVPKTGPQG